MLRLLHISDLHYQATAHQNRVISALCKDISTQSKVDAIVFSGDAAAKGQTTQEDIESILSGFISRVRSSAGSDVPFLICPGNHDVDLKKRSSIYLRIFDGIKTPKQANEVAKTAGQTEQAGVWAHMEGFRTLAKAIDSDAFTKSAAYYTKLITVGAKSIGFACLNSAWTTRGGGAADYGNLFVSEATLEQAYGEIESADLKIAVMHHPLSWLLQEEQAVIQRFLTNRFNALLCGHKHDNNANTLHTNTGHLFTSNTGCIYQTLDYFNGYSLIELNESEGVWKVNAREYYADRDTFDVSTRFAEGGCWTVPFVRSNTDLQVLIPSEVILAIHERANNRLLSYSASDLAPKSIGAMFVEPPLSFHSEKELVARSKNGEIERDAYTDLDGLAKDASTLIFIGKREAGKSILLHHIAVAGYQNFHSSARLGIVVDLQTIRKNTEAGILEQAVEFCGSEIPRKHIVQLLSAGEILVCIDNIKLHDPSSSKLVTEFLAKYPKPRYVLAASEEILDSIPGRNIPQFNGNVKKVFVHSFRKKQTRELIKRWFGESDTTLNQRVQLIDQLVARLRVPRTPFLVSVLSWVLEQRPQAHLINQSSAIEVLIEGLLEKFSESKFRKETDSTVQQYFLMEFSSHLNDLDVEWIAALDFDYFVTQYFKDRGLSVSTEGFAAEFLRKGLLYSFDDRVGFKFDCFRAFFLAKKFALTPELWKTALTKEKVRKYVYELDLLTGLHRDRRDILAAAQQLSNEIFKNYGALHSIDRVDQLEAGINQDALSVIEQVLEDHDGEGDSTASSHEQPEPTSVDHDVSRKRAHLPDAGEVTQFFESLRAFSTILRNSELVNDVQMKSECVNLALEMWAAFTNSVIRALTENSTEIAAELKIEDSQKGAGIASLVRALVPQMVVSFMSETLSTPKLELFIAEKTKDSRLLIRVMAVFLAIDADCTDAPRFVLELIRDYRKNSFVIEMLFFRLLQVTMMGGAIASTEKYRESLGETYVLLKGGTLNDASVIKARFLNALTKNIFLVEHHQKP
ncbi:MAG: metallophosphoesterase [Betaproteobacteria bacterium]